MNLQAGRRARLPRSWAVLLMPAAAFAVHQLRYYLAYGSAAGAELGRTGHSYLHSVVPWLVLLVACAAGGFLWRLGRSFSGPRSLPRYTVSFAALWVACSASLVGVFAIQEFLEGLFATGHPAGLLGIFGFGGWWAVPAAVCVGLVLAAVFHGAQWAIDKVSQRWAGARTRRASRPAPAFGPPDEWRPRLAPLADGWSGRGPPLASTLT